MLSNDEISTSLLLHYCKFNVTFMQVLSYITAGLM